MSSVVQKLGVHLKRKHGILIIRLYHKDGKAENLHNVWCQNMRTPEVKKLPLPSNLRELPNSERISFSKERNRDILGTYLAAFSLTTQSRENGHNSSESDSRIGKYNRSGSIDLSSSMQTNVPEPFSARIRPTHLNMPRGQWRQEAKYISEQLHNFHHVNIRYPHSLVRFFSSEKKSSESGEIGETGEEGLTKKQKLKVAIKKYGTTILVLYISLSLVSLGICYTLIKSGINLEAILAEQGWTDGAGVVTSAGPFVVAYAVHKVLAPLRIGLTLTIMPFVIRFLRKRGFQVKGKQ